MARTTGYIHVIMHFREEGDRDGFPPPGQGGGGVPLYDLHLDAKLAGVSKEDWDAHYDKMRATYSAHYLAAHFPAGEYADKGA